MSDSPPQLPAAKKNSSCIWLGGIGCLALVLLFVFGGLVIAKIFPQWWGAIQEYQQDATANPDKAAARLVIKLIPQVKILQEDGEAKTITFQVGPKGEPLTMHYEGLASGGKKPKITNSQGQEVEAGAITRKKSETTTAEK